MLSRSGGLGTGRGAAVIALLVLASAVTAVVIAPSAAGQAGDVDLTTADAALNSAGSGGSDLFWHGQRLAVIDTARADSDLQLRVETDEEDDSTLPVGEVALDADGEGIVRTDSIASSNIPGDFVLALDSRTFLLVDDGKVVGTTSNPDEAEFEIAPQTVDISFTSDGPGVPDPVTLEIRSNRGNYRAYVTAERTSDSELLRFFAQADSFEPTDVDGDGDGDIDDDDGIRIRVQSTQVQAALSTDPLSADRDTFTLNVTDTNAETNQTLELGGLDVTGDGRSALDPDDDGVYEDVNGDGDVTPGDATVLFNAIFENNDVVMEQPELFDFNNDGVLAPGDATVLFEEVF